MVSSAAYTKLITGFLDKYEALLSKNMVARIQDVYGWVAGYAENMAKTKSPSSRIQYMKRGANLMRYFVEQYEKDSANMAENLRQCREALLGVGGVKLPSWCTEETKNKLMKFSADFRVFARDFIGCMDSSNDFFLEKLKHVVGLLGEDYIQIKNKMEATCIHLRIEELKLQ